MSTIQKATVDKTFKSSNFNIQSIIPLVFAFAYSINFPPEIAEQIVLFITATISGGVGFWGIIRERISKGVNFTYNANVVTYIVAFFAGLFPFLAQYDLVPAIDGLVSAVISGDFGRIFSALFVIGNIIYQIVKSQRETSKEIAAA